MLAFVRSDSCVAYEIFLIPVLSHVVCAKLEMEAERDAAMVRYVPSVDMGITIVCADNYNTILMYEGMQTMSSYFTCRG